MQLIGTLKIFNKMKSILSLLYKAKWLLSGNFIFAISQWLILIMLARMTNESNLGNYALALAIVSPIFAVSNLQLRPLYILDANSKKNYKYSDFYYLRLISSFFALILCLLFSVFYNAYFFVVLLVALLKFFESYSDIIYSYYNAHNETQLISKSLLLKGVFSVIFVFLGLKFFDFYIALILFLFIYILIWVFLDNFFILKTKEIEKISLNLGIMKSAIPMGISLGIVTLQGNIPRLFLDKYEDISSVGVFTVLSYFIIVGSIFINSICQYLSPKITKSWNNDIVNFKKNLFSVSFLAFILGLIAILIAYFFGRYFLTLFYGAKYSIYNLEMLNIMVAGLFLYLSTVFGYTLTSIGFVRKQVLLFSLVLICSLCFSSYLIPMYGLNGAIYTLIASYIVQCFSSLFIILFLIKAKKK